MKEYNIPFSPPDISEIEINEVIDTLKSGWITTGAKTKLFEGKIAEYCKADKAVCLNSATAALELTLRVLGIGEGDEVITSAYTYTASASVICHVGATPIMVDVKNNSYEMDYDKLSDAITAKTKAIIPVDIAGVPCDYDKIFEIVEAKKALFKGQNSIAKSIGRVAIVDDAAHAFGASYKSKPVGSIADFTCFSFHAVKNLTTGEGGAVTFCGTNGKNVEDIYKQYMLLSLHGQSKDALAKTKLGAWEYDIMSPAYKCNMTDIMAAIGLGQLSRYEGLLARRQEIIEKYNKGFEGTMIEPLVHNSDEFCSSKHLYLTRLIGKDIEFRNNTIIELAKVGISANVHYKPLPMLTAYKNLGFCIKDYPNAYAMYQNEITLPLHTRLTDDEIEYIINEYIRIVNCK
ncbi:MAG: DegT/DnrJ/EryC1/StrS aminotransferase family protein [Oscillospiraceae bacterium]